jgi:transcriptional regulator with XRE-family HTH domain
MARKRSRSAKTAAHMVPERDTYFTRSLRRARERLGRSEEEMALACRITCAQWFQLERGQYRPSDEVVIRLAEELGLDQHELLFEAALQDFSGE